MQQRRFRPGDVLDDYCPRERRITDHAIVAMIDDHIKQTRCVVCDAEHEYKEGKVPPQRRKKAQSALFAQVLDGLQGPPPAARLAATGETDDHEPTANAPLPLDARAGIVAAQRMEGGNGHPDASRSQASSDPRPAVAHDGSGADDEDALVSTNEPRDEGPVRRPLIRAVLPRPEGQPVVTRALPEFTIRQPHTGRGGPRQPTHRRRAGHHQPQGQGSPGPSRFGRGGGQGQRPQGGRPPHGNGGRGPRRGGKKR